METKPDNKTYIVLQYWGNSDTIEIYAFKTDVERYSDKFAEKIRESYEDNNAVIIILEATPINVANLRRIDREIERARVINSSDVNE